MKKFVDRKRHALSVVTDSSTADSSAQRMISAGKRTWLQARVISVEGHTGRTLQAEEGVRPLGWSSAPKIRCQDQKNNEVVGSDIGGDLISDSL